MAQTSGVLQGETYGPFFGWEQAEGFQTMLVNLGLIEAWGDFDSSKEPPASEKFFSNLYTHLQALLK